MKINGNFALVARLRGKLRSMYGTCCLCMKWKIDFRGALPYFVRFILSLSAYFFVDILGFGLRYGEL